MAQKSRTLYRPGIGVTQDDDDYDTIYFAYGSNLSFEQMAARCPNSRFVGCARLHNYRFHINERGFANVLRSHPAYGDYVDGLCYRLSRSDEQALDRSEGVPTAYQKQELEVESLGCSEDFVGRDVVDIARRLRRFPSQAAILHRGRSEVSAPRGTYYTPTERLHYRSPGRRMYVAGERMDRNISDPKRSSSMPARITARLPWNGRTWQAKVYLSTIHVRNGLPWDEYITRMELGLQDAEMQGISREYIDQCVRPLLKEGRGQRIRPGQHPTRKRKQGNRLNAFLGRAEYRDR